MIGPGSRTAWYVQVARTNGFAGPVKVEVKGLPAGVTVNPLTIPATMTQGLLVVSAAADAKMDASAVTITGTADATDETAKPVTLDARPRSRWKRSTSPAAAAAVFDAGMQAVAVTGPSDLVAVKVKQTRVVLKPGEEVKIDVEVVRGPEYDEGRDAGRAAAAPGQRVRQPAAAGRDDGGGQEQDAARAAAAWATSP